MGDGRTYDYVVALRAVQTEDFMTAHWVELPYALLGKISNRIVNEVRGINRVVYDILRETACHDRVGIIPWSHIRLRSVSMTAMDQKQIC